MSAVCDHALFSIGSGRTAHTDAKTHPKYLAKLLPKLPLAASTELKFLKRDHNKLSFS